MANDVFANGRELACKAGQGKSTCAFPDICFTPPENPATPPGVPVPYPNTGFASDTTNGTRNVKISGKEVIRKNVSYYKKSMGDEAGCAAKKGVITSVNRGKVYFKSWSMDVKFEGKNVTRHLDATTHNHASDTANENIPWPDIDTMARSKHPCRKEKQKEKEACNDYKPKGDKDPCKEAGLSGPVIQSGSHAKAGRFKNANTWADSKGRRAAAHECVSARRCKLVPYHSEKDGVNGCCPSQTADHLIPKSSFYKVSFEDGELLDEWKNYDYKKAPCMCAEGGSNTTGTHGLRHAHHKANGPGKDVMQSFNKEADLAAESAMIVFKSSGCNKECIKAQLKNGHKDFGDLRRKVKHSPSGSDMTNEEIISRSIRYTPETISP